MSDISQWCLIFENIISPDQTLRDNASSAILEAQKNPLSFIKVCLSIISMSEISHIARQQAFILLCQQLKPSFQMTEEQLQSMWFSIEPPEVRTQIKTFIMQTIQDSDAIISNKSCQIYALIFAIEGESWPEALTLLLQFCNDINMAEYGFKIASEIAQLTFNLSVVFNDAYLQIYSLLMQAAVGVINSPPDSTGASCQVRLNAVNFLNNILERIPSIGENQEALSQLFLAFPNSFVVTNSDLFRSLHNLMIACLRINYLNIPIEDLNPENPSHKSFLPLLLQYGIRSLGSNFQDEKYLIIALQFWEDLARIEVNNIFLFDHDIEVEATQSYHQLDISTSGKTQYIGTKYQQDEAAKAFEALQQEIKEKNLYKHHILGICKSVSHVVLPLLFNYMKQIDPGKTDIEDITEETVSKAAHLAFKQFAYAANDEVNQFFKDTFISVASDPSWISNNTALMMMIAIASTQLDFAKHSSSFELVKQTLVTPEINAKALILKWSSPESHPYLRESSLFTLSFLINCDNSLVITGVFGLDLLIPFLNTIIQEFSQDNIPNPFIYARALQVLYRAIESWKNVTYQNPLPTILDSILTLINSSIAIGTRLKYPFGLKMSFECLSMLVRSIPFVDQNIQTAFFQVLATDIQIISEQKPETIQSKDVFVSLFSSVLENIASIALKMNKFTVQYPTMINNYFDSIMILFQYPELHSDALLAIGSLVKWSGGSKNLTTNIGENVLRLAHSSFASQSPEIILSSCLLISDIFECETRETENPLFYPHALQFFQTFMECLSKPSGDLFAMSFLLHSLSSIIVALTPEVAAGVRPQVLQLIIALRTAKITFDTDREMNGLNLYLEQLGYLYSALAKSYDPELYRPEERKQIESEQLREMHELFKTFHLTKEECPNPPGFHDFSERTHLMLVKMISDFTDKTSRVTNTILNRAPAKLYLKVIITSPRVKSDSLKKEAQNVYKKMGQT